MQANEATTVLAASKTCAVQAIKVGKRAYGLQMHIELVPEMLAVWAAQDPDLRGFDPMDLQKELAAISTTYLATGRRLLTNFMVTTGLITEIDLATDVNVQDQTNVH